MNIGQMIKLTWKSSHAKQVLKDHGNIWEVVDKFHNTPVIRIMSEQTKAQRNINWPTNDPDFLIWRILTDAGN